MRPVQAEVHFFQGRSYNVSHTAVLKNPADDTSTSDDQKDLSGRLQRTIQDFLKLLSIVALLLSEKIHGKQYCYDQCHKRCSQKLQNRLTTSSPEYIQKLYCTGSIPAEQE